MIKGVIYEVAEVSNVKEKKKSPVNYEDYGNKPQLDVAGLSERVKGRSARYKLGKPIYIPAGIPVALSADQK